MNNKLFISIGMVALLISLQGCMKYKDNNNNFIVDKNQSNVAITLGDSYNTFLYNVKSPINVTIQAPDGNLIVYENSRFEKNYKITLKPQQSIDLTFKVIDLKKLKELEDPTQMDKLKSDYVIHVRTFKNNYVISNAVPHLEKSGKSTILVGYNLFYNLLDKQDKTYIELHEFNNYNQYSFNYRGPTKDLEIALKAPENNSFVFKNGTESKEYTIKIKQNQTITFNFLLKADYDKRNENIYTRELKFSLKN